jgi:hypothetical protein
MFAGSPSGAIEPTICPEAGNLFAGIARFVRYILLVWFRCRVTPGSPHKPDQLAVLKTVPTLRRAFVVGLYRLYPIIVTPGRTMRLPGGNSMNGGTSSSLAVSTSVPSAPTFETATSAPLAIKVLAPSACWTLPSPVSSSPSAPMPPQPASSTAQPRD